MSPRRTLGTLLVLAVGGLGLAVTPAVVPAAHAVTGSPPVTTPDAVSVFQGGFAEVQPVNNDHDPDNDQLAICRLGTEHYRGMQAIFIENDWAVFAKRKAKPGIYTFTYYACDYQALVPGTLTVTIDPEPEVTAKAIAGQPGKIKVTNPADFKIKYFYGSFKQPEPDGIVKIAKKSSVILSVRRTQIDWIAYTRKDEFITQGKIKNIKLPPGTTPPAAGRSVSPRVAKLWSSAV